MFANQLVDLTHNWYEHNEQAVWGENDFLRHVAGKVCKLGVGTGVLMVLLIGLQLYFLINLDLKKDKRAIFWIKWISLIILSIYFILQFIMNSWASHVVRGYRYSIGLWEYMLPTYALQFGILYILFNVKTENFKS